MGSVFSPYYALARRNGRGDPENHCALNVALYGKGGKRWAMTERTSADLRRAAESLSIGPSNLVWDGSALTVSFDERTVPFPSRLAGRVRLEVGSLWNHVEKLDEHGRHIWRPLAPRVRVTVDLTDPQLSWQGAGYLDCNYGEEPLERAFTRWDWSRAHTETGAALLYDIERRDGSEHTIALHMGDNGELSCFAPPPRQKISRTGWRVGRATRSDVGTSPRVIATLEDTPFYARSLIATHLFGAPVSAVHESLSLDRLVRPVVRLMLPFRMPRWRYRG